MSKWKLVPVDATDAMIGAALDVNMGRVATYRETYNAMLDAAPAAPVQQAEPVGYFQRDCDYFEQVEDVYQWDADVIPLYLHPPPAEVQRLREAAYNAIEAFDQGAHGADEIDALRRALEGGE